MRRNKAGGLPAGPLKKELAGAVSFSYNRGMRLLLFIFVVCLSFPAVAGEDQGVIKIIHDDGSVDVIDLRQQQPAEPVEDAVSEPVPEASPAPKATVKKATHKPEKKPEKKSVSRKPVQKATLPAPAPAPEIIKPPPLPIQRDIQSGAVITRGRAVSIALRYAPPSSDVEVFRSVFEGQDVFAVVFKTEEGFHEVLVDSRTGKVLASRESDDFQAKAAPGYLPKGLR